VLLQTMLQMLHAWYPAFQTEALCSSCHCPGSGHADQLRTPHPLPLHLGSRPPAPGLERRLSPARSCPLETTTALPAHPGESFAFLRRPLCGGCHRRYTPSQNGRKIESAFYQRDPLSPKFRFNLMFGLRFLQIALLLPLHRQHQTSARALPVRF
jgi:hypothetical protein